MSRSHALATTSKDTRSSRSWLKGLALLACGGSLGIVTLGSGCAVNSQSVYIRGVVPPTIQNGACLFDVNTQVYAAVGQLDVSLATGYTGVFLVQTDLSVRGDRTNGKAEPNRFAVKGAEVQLLDEAGKQLSTYSTSVTTAIIDPVEGSRALVTANLMDPALAKSLVPQLANGQRKRLVANFRVFGSTLGNQDLDSAYFQFPIDVCVGCGVDFSTGDDPTTPTLDCSRPLADSAKPASTCFLGQDGVTDCHLCSAHAECSRP